jgi:hypothetical protein
MSISDSRQWWLNRNRPRDPAGDAAIGGLTVGVVLVAILVALVVIGIVLRVAASFNCDKKNPKSSASCRWRNPKSLAGASAGDLLVLVRQER